MPRATPHCLAGQCYVYQVSLRPVGAAIVEKPVTRKKALPPTQISVFYEQHQCGLRSGKVPHTMTVGELKRLAQLLFKQVHGEVQPAPLRMRLDRRCRWIG